MCVISCCCRCIVGKDCVVRTNLLTIKSCILCFSAFLRSTPFSTSFWRISLFRDPFARASLVRLSFFFYRRKSFQYYLGVSCSISASLALCFSPAQPIADAQLSGQLWTSGQRCVLPPSRAILARAARKSWCRRCCWMVSTRFLCASRDLEPSASSRRNLLFDGAKLLFQKFLYILCRLALLSFARLGDIDAFVSAVALVFHKRSHKGCPALTSSTLDMSELSSGDPTRSSFQACVDAFAFIILHVFLWGVPFVSGDSTVGSISWSWSLSFAPLPLAVSAYAASPPSMSTSADFVALLLPLPLLALLTFFFFFFSTLLEGTGGLVLAFWSSLFLTSWWPCFLHRSPSFSNVCAKQGVFEQQPADCCEHCQPSVPPVHTFLNGIGFLVALLLFCVVPGQRGAAAPRPPLWILPQIISEKILTSSLMAVMSPSQIRLPFRCDMSTRNAVVKALMMSCAFSCSLGVLGNRTIPRTRTRNIASNIATNIDVAHCFSSATAAIGFACEPTADMSLLVLRTSTECSWDCGSARRVWRSA